MFSGNIVGLLDVAELSFWGFVVFFIGLVFWLRREDRREGYPREESMTGLIETPGGPLDRAPPKLFRLPHGQGTVYAGDKDRDPLELPNAERREHFGGAPYWPKGNPLKSGMGPASYAKRATYPDVDLHGRPRIVPMASDPEFSIAAMSREPRGLPVYGADGARAGTVSDVWVDRSEHIIRYLEVDTGAGATVLAPMAMARVNGEMVRVDAINAADFAEAPMVGTAGQITRDEEERIMAYFGGGYLWANVDREEPFV